MYFRRWMILIFIGGFIHAQWYHTSAGTWNPTNGYSFALYVWCLIILGTIKAIISTYHWYKSGTLPIQPHWSKLLFFGPIPWIMSKLSKYGQVAVIAFLYYCLGNLFIILVIIYFGLVEIKDIVTDFVYNFKDHYEANAPTISIPVKLVSSELLATDILETFSVAIKYSPFTTMGNIIDEIEKHCQRNYPYFKYINIICDVNVIDSERYNALRSKAVTDFEQNDLITQGLVVRIQCEVLHDPKALHMAKMCGNVTGDPSQCPIYKAMKENYQFTKTNLSHLNEFRHFQDEYLQRPKCRYNQECHAFIRLKDGGYRLDDRCHTKLYSHTPRNDRQIKLTENMHAFIFNSDNVQNVPLKMPTYIASNLRDGYLTELIQEVIKNGYKYDLCKDCRKNDVCDHDVVNDKEYSLLTVVDEKMDHIRHKQLGSPLNRGQMLAFLLYTGLCTL